MAVTPSRSAPVSRNPTTCGVIMYSGWPSMAASASMPPTPQPSTPRPLIIVVCESVPTSVSGKAIVFASLRVLITPAARNSRFTWCTMPVAGGTTPKFWKPCAPHLRNS